MKRLFSIILSLGIFTMVSAQLPPITDGLIAYYSFDNCDATDDTGGGSDGVIVGSPGCGCGVSGNSLELDGLNDYVLFLGSVNNYFDTDNLTISFYFKSFGSPLAQDILSKQEDCGTDNALSIVYTPTFNSVTATMSEDASKKSEADATLDFSNCWHHVVIIRKGGKTILYLDGVWADEATAISRVDLENSAALSLANSPCIGAGVNRFKGYIDELAIYSDDILETQAEDLYLSPDQIANRDTLLYLGESLDVELASTCANNFAWTPTTGVDDPTSGTPSISPTETTTYRLNFTDENGCTSYDTVKITIIDPSNLDCNKIFVPKAFTPNGTGPINNETIGISNPYAIEELLSFEIFDRWGERVFQTDDPFMQWDGNLAGKNLNPGVFLYKLEYKCSGKVEQQFGSLSLLR